MQRMFPLLNRMRLQDDDKACLRATAAAMFLLLLFTGINKSHHIDDKDDDSSIFSYAYFFSSTTIMLRSFERYAVLSYTLLALLYLTAVACRPEVVHRYIWKPLLSPQGPLDIDTRKPQPQQQHDLVTAETMPLEEEFSGEGQEELNGTLSPPKQQRDQPINLSGAFQLVSNENFDGFLAEQGISWALRHAANKARPIHRITHVGCSLTIKIEGLIESQTTYIIGGPPIETSVRTLNKVRVFEDQVSYLTIADVQMSNSSDLNTLTYERKNVVVGIKVHKRAIQENYTIMVHRQLSADQRELTMTSSAFFNDGRKSVCKQHFKRIE